MAVMAPPWLSLTHAGEFLLSVLASLHHNDVTVDILWLAGNISPDLICLSCKFYPNTTQVAPPLAVTWGRLPPLPPPHSMALIYGEVDLQ